MLRTRTQKGGKIKGYILQYSPRKRLSDTERLFCCIQKCQARPRKSAEKIGYKKGNKAKKKNEKGVQWRTK